MRNWLYIILILVSHKSSIAIRLFVNKHSYYAINFEIACAISHRTSHRESDLTVCLIINLYAKLILYAKSSLLFKYWPPSSVLLWPWYIYLANHFRLMIQPLTHPLKYHKLRDPSRPQKPKTQKPDMHMSTCACVIPKRV